MSPVPPPDSSRVYARTPPHPGTDRSAILAVICDAPGQGIVTSHTPLGPMPVVSMDPAMRPTLERIAAEMARATGEPVKVVRYVREPE